MQFSTALTAQEPFGGSRGAEVTEPRVGSHGITAVDLMIPPREKVEGPDLMHIAYCAGPVPVPFHYATSNTIQDLFQ